MEDNKETKKELNEEDLNQVSGGRYPGNLGFHIGQYDAYKYIGREVYCLRDNDHAYWCYGTLVKSYEKSVGCGTERRQEIMVHNYGDSIDWKDSDCELVTVGYVASFHGKYYSLYLKEN